MNYKILTIATIIVLIFSTSCSRLEKMVYHPNITQGNYLTTGDVAKIHTGMTKQQVAFTIGTPIIKDPFDSNNWYYIVHYKQGHELISQQILILTFSNSGILLHIDNKLTPRNH